MGDVAGESPAFSDRTLRPLNPPNPVCQHSPARYISPIIIVPWPPTQRRLSAGGNFGGPPPKTCGKAWRWSERVPGCCEWQRRPRPDQPGSSASETFHGQAGGKGRCCQHLRTGDRRVFSPRCHPSKRMEESAQCAWFRKQHGRLGLTLKGCLGRREAEASGSIRMK